MKFMRVRQSLTVLCLTSMCVLAACSSKPRAPVPVEDRVAGSGSTPTRKSNVPQQPSAAVAVSTPVSMGASMPGSENAGKPGYYSVRAGDTLTKIALDHGQAWRDIAKWNGLDNPNVIEIDQVLRVVPPTVEAGPSRQAANKPGAATGTTTSSAAAPAASAPTASSAPAASSATSSAANTADDGLGFAWPHPGQVIAGFDEAKNKGLDFAGKAGDPVLAAADGKVVYAGSGLRGYGNLVILKHNNTYLSAYAHNQTLLVKEDQNVTKGQRIAEMGSTDADRVKLHFEIRKQGKPVDPSKYLPARP
jgi:lipoprotein NlpD